MGLVGRARARAGVALAFRRAARAPAAADHAGREANALYTLGVVPTRPETGFGYIVADGERVSRFTEKPNRDEAERLIAAGARWNAGTFAWRRDSARAALEQFAPTLINGIGEYSTVPAGPIDTFVMEPGESKLPKPPISGKAEGERPHLPVLERRG